MSSLYVSSLYVSSLCVSSLCMCVCQICMGHVWVMFVCIGHVFDAVGQTVRLQDGMEDDGLRGYVEQS